jgi:hypothetical protein
MYLFLPMLTGEGKKVVISALAGWGGARVNLRKGGCCTVQTQVAVQHHFKADTDPNFHFNADPDPAPRQSNANLRPLIYRPSMTPF